MSDIRRHENSAVMADPFSTIAGIISIIGAVINSSKKLFELVRHIKDADEEIQAISRDVQALHTILSSLDVSLNDEDVRHVIVGDESMAKMVGNLGNPLSNCRLVLESLTAKIQKQLRPATEGRRPLLINVKWSLFVKGEIKDLQLRLEAAKSTLGNALDAITTYVLFDYSKMS